MHATFNRQDATAADAGQPTGAGAARRGRPVDPVSGLSRQEDRVSSGIQTVGLLCSLLGIALLLLQAARGGAPRVLVATTIYSVSLVMLYSISATYHGALRPGLKRVLRKLDHISIYVFIAGSYTPFTLVTLQGAWGWSLFGVVWGLAALGAIWKLFSAGHLPALSTALYVLMGWVVLVGIAPLLRALPPGGVALLAGGGVAYTLGAAIFLARRIPYNHAIWQGFVLLGAALQYLSILLFVVSPG